MDENSGMEKESVNFEDPYCTGGYDSAFESDYDRDRRQCNSTLDPKPAQRASASSSYEKETTESRNQGIRQFLALDAYTRHKKLINEYFLYYPGATKSLVRDTSRDKTDFDIIRENHQFLWNEDEELGSWGKTLAKKYYDKLFKEYCICDLTHYKTCKIAMRWRTEQEVISGKGQFSCGEKKCNQGGRLRTWEVNFGYVEQSEKKNALVKLRLCSDCSFKLNYRFQRKELTKKDPKVDTTASSYKGKKRKSGDERSEASDDQNKKIANDADGEKDAEEEDENSVWSKAAERDAEEIDIQEEFEHYLSDMFL